MLASTSDQETPRANGTVALRLLWVSASGNRGEWLQQALTNELACPVELLVATDQATALANLVHEPCDAILVQHTTELDGLEFAIACRGSSYEEPLIVLGHELASDFEPLVYEAGADAYVCLEQASIRGLYWTITRARQRWELERQNQRLLQQEQQRVNWEHEEAARLIAEQRALLNELTASPAIAKPVLDLPLRAISSRRRKNETGSPAAVIDRTPMATTKQLYRELLRTYVIMGSGNLGSELQQLAQTLVEQQVGSQQTMLMHLEVVEQMVAGLGQRSARHLLTRADLLVLELMMALAEGYRSSG